MDSDLARAVFRQGGDVVACELEAGKALLDLGSSNYFKLNDTAALIWEWLGEGATIPSLVERMLAMFDVDEDECARDVEAIILSFEEAGLVESEGAESA